MKIKILQTTTTILTEDRQVESTYTNETFILEAEKGKVLKNIKTGKVSRSRVCVTKKSKLDEYIEINDPNVLLEDPKIRLVD